MLRGVKGKWQKIHLAEGEWREDVKTYGGLEDRQRTAHSGASCEAAGVRKQAGQGSEGTEQWCQQSFRHSRAKGTMHPRVTGSAQKSLWWPEARRPGKRQHRQGRCEPSRDLSSGRLGHQKQQRGRGNAARSRRQVDWHPGASLQKPLVLLKAGASLKRCHGPSWNGSHRAPSRGERVQLTAPQKDGRRAEGKPNGRTRPITTGAKESRQHERLESQRNRKPNLLGPNARTGSMSPKTRTELRRIRTPMTKRVGRGRTEQSNTRCETRGHAVNRPSSAKLLSPQLQQPRQQREWSDCCRDVRWQASINRPRIMNGIPAYGKCMGRKTVC